jgi:hypothetical protein
MFNQLTPSDIVSAIGVTARDAARSHDPAGEFERDQLLSAYSATRHLAVELSSYGPEWTRFREAVTARIAAAIAAGDATTADLADFAARLEADASTAGVGATLGDLLAALRDDDAPAATALRADLHAELRALADREVDLLADAL